MLNKYPSRSIFSPPNRIAYIAFLFSAAVTASFMAMPFVVFNQLGKGAFVSGIFAGVQAAGYTIASLISSPFVSRTKHGLLWGLVGVAGFMLFMTAMPFFKVVWMCGAMFTLAFTLSALAWPSFHSWAGTEPIPEQRARYMGRINVGWSTGGAMGPFLAGPLYEIDYRLPFLFVGVVCLATLYLLWTMPHESTFFSSVSPDIIRQRAAHDQASESFLWCAWLATFSAHISIGAARSVFPKRLNDIIAAGNLSIFQETEILPWLNSAAATRFSWLVVALSLATAVTFFLLGKTTWWHHRFSLLVGIQLLVGGAMWTLGHTTSFLLMGLAFIVIGTNLGIAFFSSAYYGMANPSRKHGRAAVNEGVVGVGGMVGSFGFAFLGDQFGIEVPFRWMPSIMVLICLIQFLLLNMRNSYDNKTL